MTYRHPVDAVEQAKAVLEAWKEIDPALQIGGLAASALEANLNQVNTLYAELNKLDAQITDMRNQRDALIAATWDQVKRVRTGVKGIYGDDSSEYEMVGGTRLSDRKPRSLKKETA